MDNLLLTAIVFLPAVAAFLLMLIPKLAPEACRMLTFAVTAIVFVLTIVAAVEFNRADAHIQSYLNEAWIPSFSINYFIGIDGISLPLIMLTSFISMLAMAASWTPSLNKHIKAYCVLFLFLETGMLGVFVALDFFLFYVFWEVMLLPMYFLIGVWGGPRREYAAIKFFLYTLVGSVLMLIAILLLYFNSDLRSVAQVSEVYGDQQVAVVWKDLRVSEREEAQMGIFRDNVQGGQLVIEAAKGETSLRLLPSAEGDSTSAWFDQGQDAVVVAVHPDQNTLADVQRAIKASSDTSAKLIVNLASGAHDDDAVSDAPVHTFNLLALAAIGQHTDNFSTSLQRWAFILLFIGFAIKVPSVPVHTWLPDAHVEAPTPISMILAGVLLKMGGYGIIRICYPICPAGGCDLALLVCAIGVISMVYGAFAAMAQTDFKRLVAYSSVSHMGYVVLGLGVWSAFGANGYNADYWNMGVKGAMFQMIGHGVSSAGMFFMVGIVYDRVHHRNLNEFGGLFSKMPIYTALSIGIFFAGLGLPGLCGFIGEVLVVLSVWNYSPFLAIVSASVVIITAAYILWTIQRVYLGAEYTGPHEEALTPINSREFAVGVTLFIFAIIFGVFPHSIPTPSGDRIPTVLEFMDASIDRQTDELADWTRENRRGHHMPYWPWDDTASATRATSTQTADGTDRNPKQQQVTAKPAPADDQANLPLKQAAAPTSSGD